MILGFAHPAIVVPDLDKAVAFYCEMFGFKHFCDEGWQPNAAVDRLIGSAGSTCRGCTLAGHNSYLELFEFSAPPPTAPAPGDLGPHEPGIRHLCFYVDDCRQEYRRFLELGGRELGQPVDIGGGVYTVYGRDPFGNIIELAEFPSTEEDLRNLPGVNCLGDFKS